MKNKKDRSVTVRVEIDVYERLTMEAIERSVKEKRIVKVSELIREKISK